MWPKLLRARLLFQSSLSPGAVEPAAPAPLKPGGEGTPNNNSEPAPLKPAEEPATEKPDAEPLALGDKPDGTPADRHGAATGTKDNDGFFVDEPELVCKRSGTCNFVWIRSGALLRKIVKLGNTSWIRLRDRATTRSAFTRNVSSRNRQVGTVIAVSSYH
jgi:hypothetical protein